MHVDDGAQESREETPDRIERRQVGPKRDRQRTNERQTEDADELMTGNQAETAGHEHVDGQTVRNGRQNHTVNDAACRAGRCNRSAQNVGQEPETESDPISRNILRAVLLRPGGSSAPTANGT